MASLVTRCPACGTLFKVVPDQLRISDGWVRCGQCDEVFDAQAQMQPQVVPAPDAVADARDVPHAADTPAPVPPSPAIVREVPAAREPAVFDEDQSAVTVEPRGQQGHTAFADEPTVDVGAAPSPQWEETAFTESAKPAPAAVADGEEPAAASASFLQQRRIQRPAHPGPTRWLWRLAALALVMGLAGQIVVQERDRIAATEPALTGALNTLCQAWGCRVAPLQQIESVVIESSSFIKVRADVYRLSFSLKNTALVPLSLPAAELALTDLRDQSVVRRVLSPVEYGARSATLGAGEELSVVVPLAVTNGGAASDKVTGYRLLVFYP